MDAVPKVGDKHHFFDDGKIKESRHYIAEVLEVITPEEAENVVFDLIEYDDWDKELKDWRIKKPINKTLYEIWREEVDGHRQGDKPWILVKSDHFKPNAPWLYEEETDFFVKCSIPEYDELPIWFVRDIDGGWFSMDTEKTWMSGLLMPIEFDWEEYLLQQEKEIQEWLNKHKK